MTPRRWEKDGTTEAIHGALRRKVRKAAGRSEQPTAAIVDAQSIRTSANVAESSQGIDAAKKIRGRKRHIATGTLGLLLVLLVTAASVQDTTGGRDAIDELAARHLAVVKTWVDSGYKRSVTERGAAHGIEVQVIYWAMIDNMSRRLTGESTQTWRDHSTEPGESLLT
jgi:transposase